MKKQNEQSKLSHNTIRGLFSALIIVLVVALSVKMTGNPEKMKKDASHEAPLPDLQQIYSHPNFSSDMSPTVANLGSSDATTKYWAAVQLLETLPDCLPCLQALGETALTFQDFDQAVEASQRLLELVPENAAAVAMHQETLQAKKWFDGAVLAAQARMLQLPDDKFHHRWAPLAELTANELSKHDATMSSLREMWRGIQEQDPALASEIVAKMNRQWAIETGRVENLYSLSEGLTAALIQHGISVEEIASDPIKSLGEATEIDRILKDQERVIQSLTKRATEDNTAKLNVTKELLYDLQLDFTNTSRFTVTGLSNGQKAKVLIRRGKFKNQPNYPTRPDGRLHMYCPVDRVEEEMDRLLALTEQYYEQDDAVAPEVLAAWLHHRFVAIHPFHDGNGRVARSLASLVLMKQGLLPFTVRLRDRPLYFECLERADHGDLVPFVNFIVRQQRDSLLLALSMAGDRVNQVTSRFTIVFEEDTDKLDHVTKFAAVLQEDLKATMAEYLDGLRGSVGLELVAPNQMQMVYEKHGLQVPDHLLHQSLHKRVVWFDESKTTLISFYVLPLLPSEWGMHLVVGMVEVDDVVVPMLDGQFFDFSSTALQSPDEVQRALKSWLEYCLWVGLGFADSE